VEPTKAALRLIAMAMKQVRGWLTNIGVFAARPAAFVVFLAGRLRQMA
jgi:hypothetical protein